MTAEMVPEFRKSKGIVGDGCCVVRYDVNGFSVTDSERTDTPTLWFLRVNG